MYDSLIEGKVDRTMCELETINVSGHDRIGERKKITQELQNRAIASHNSSNRM